MLNATRSAIKLIAHFFSPINALAGKPVFTVTADSVIVHVFYYIPDTSKALNNNTVNNLGQTLSSLFRRPVELRLVKLHYPYLNSYILAQYIALNTLDYTLVQIARRIFGSIAPVKNTQSVNVLASDLPSHIVGIKVRVSGRLMTERSRPRQTVQTAQIGSFAKGNLSLVDSASFTTKNKKGAFTVKVWISQRAVA
jgi:ribosomal protein S3